MRWTLTEDQELFRDSFRGWLERFAPMRDREPAEFERRFVAEGWFGVGTPEHHGGQGGGLEIGRAHV